MTIFRTPFLTVSLFLLLAPAAPAAGRVISYSPITDQAAVPAHQHRMNRYFVLVEGPATTAGIIGGRSSTYPGGANLVLYDSNGEDEPRVIYPPEGRPLFYAVAVHESAAGVPWIFAFVQEGGFYARLSVDAGATWKTLDIPIAHQLPAMHTFTDTGGPYTSSRGSLIRIGNDEWPFIVSTRLGLWAVRADGTIRTLAQQGFNAEVDAIGRDAGGTRFLVTAAGRLYIFDIINRTTTLIGTSDGRFVDGWITSGGDVYVEELHGRVIRILHFRNGMRTMMLEAGGDAMDQNVFAIPTHDSNAAWIIRRGLGKPTTLYKHSAATGIVQHWQDESGPEVEALHTGSSGTKLLVQVHRPRTERQRVFLDPALAVWNVGDPSPAVYDELYIRTTQATWRQTSQPHGDARPADVAQKKKRRSNDRRFQDQLN